MNRIERVINSSNKLLIPYITPEFPFKNSSLEILEALVRAGSDMIEVGIPFSDPIADGPTIQHSSFIALKNGASLRKIFEIVGKFRTKFETPIILMGYVNSIVNIGVEKFIQMAVDNGVDGLIVPDLPVEEADEILNFSARYGLSNIFLIAPTSSSERIKLISSLSTHFSYCVSVTGTTGEREKVGDDDFESFMKRVAENSLKPFVVGFGISKREHVLQVWRWAMGAVVGSALIKKISAGKSTKECAQIAYEFIRGLKNGALVAK